MTCIFFASCRDGSKAKFEITNNTSANLDSVFIEQNISTECKYISIPAGALVKYVSFMGKGLPDGAYQLNFKISSIQKREVFGYYANGSSMEKLTKIQIMPDTILIRQYY